jgi:surface antigen
MEAPVHRDRIVRLGVDGGPRVVTPAKPISCVPFAREGSGIAIYGDAYTWWDQAHGRYGEYDTPRVGSVMVLIGYAGPKHGHLAVVRRIVSDREIRVDHANWLNDGNVYLNTPVVDVSDDNDWSAVRVWNPRDNRLGAGTYHVQGFIAPTTVAARRSGDES